MGGRIASHLPERGVACDGLVFLGYPLHPPGRPDRIRDRHLYALSTPCLFVEGTRDPFCPVPLLEEVRAKMSAPTSLVVVEDGDHSFKVRKSSGRSNQEALDKALEGVSAWIGSLSDSS
jgi:predicted alpha/beta-hydrolase family hydrolase